MEEDQELYQFKHACKFCNKSFPCGRSLGGHMRSHIINMSAAETQEKEKLAMKKKKKKKKKPSSSNGGGGCNGSEAGYGLRENPKKTWRIADSSEDTLFYDKFCKECGKSFHSWKALCGHMKCHSEKERVCNSLEDQDSWTNTNNANANANASSHTQKMVLDTQSDNETTAPNKRKRSKRRRARYMAAATSSVVSFANPSSSSVSEVEQEQEEVAMSLMMLSRDVSPWTGLHSLAESSDNNSAYFQEARSSVRTNLVTKFDTNKKDSTNITKMIKQSDRENNFKGKNSELLDAEDGFRMIKSGVSIKGFLKATKSELDYMSALEDSEGEQGRSRVNGTESVLSKSATMKTKYVDSELKSSYLNNWVNKSHEGEFSKNSIKRGKFECTTCNKIFHSYQALGGHRASHKKIKGCFASKIESSEVENSIETDISPDPTTESKLMVKNSENSEYVHYEAEIVKESKKNKVHECPVCLKVFQSGQALGGHKRSHMSGVSESRNFQTVVIQEPVHEIRDFLDLNLPAANDEESNSHADSNRPWWVVEGNHKQEASCLG